MTDESSPNPYISGNHQEDVMQRPSASPDGILTKLLAIFLIFRGAQIILACWMTFANAQNDFTNIFAATLTKEIITGGTAFLGGIFLIARKQIGWWFTIVYITWLFAWDVVLVTIANAFKWNLPVRFDRSLLNSTMIENLVFVILIFYFLCTPALQLGLRMQTVPSIQRVISVMIAVLLAASIVNYWSGLA